jgi:hypothetical protein
VPPYPSRVRATRYAKEIINAVCCALIEIGLLIEVQSPPKAKVTRSIRVGCAILRQSTPRHPGANRLLARCRRLRTGFAAARRLTLNQVPAVATEILENRDDAIGLISWLLNEPHAGCDHARMVAIEIIRL